VTIQPLNPNTTQAANSYERQLLLKQMGQTGLDGQPVVADTLIYLGPEFVQPAIPGKRGSLGVPATTGMVTTEVAKGAYAFLLPEAKKRFDDAIEVITGERPTGLYAYSQWQSMVDNSAILSQAVNRPVSVFETAELMAAQSPAKAKEGGGPTTTISTTETIDLSSPSEARRLLDNTLGGYLGRLPTQKEYKNFLNVLNAAEEEMPQITEQVSRSVPGKGTSRVSTKVRGEGGLSREQVTTEFVRGQEDYAETRLSNVGLTAFLELLQ
jgi:hypothetical protein